MQGAHQPTPEQIRDCLADKFPHLTGEPIVLLGEGWVSWAFKVGLYVLRFPKSPAAVRGLEKECRLAPLLRGWLPCPVTEPRLLPGGPNDLPFSIHDFIRGVGLSTLSRAPGPGFAASLGRFVRAVHNFPVTGLEKLGIRRVDGTAKREECLNLYDRIGLVAFPLLTPAARTFTERTFDRYLANSAHFDFEPTLTHRDIDERNVLADPISGELTGVIDFGDARIDDPAEDFVCPTGGYAEFSIPFQLDRFITAYDSELDLGAYCKRARFYRFRWPFSEIFQGVERADNALLERGLRRLSEEWVR